MKTMIPERLLYNGRPIIMSEERPKRNYPLVDIKDRYPGVHFIGHTVIGNIEDTVIIRPGATINQDTTTIMGRSFIGKSAHVENARLCDVVVGDAALITGGAVLESSEVQDSVPVQGGVFSQCRITGCVPGGVFIRCYVLNTARPGTVFNTTVKMGTFLDTTIDIGNFANTTIPYSGPAAVSTVKALTTFTPPKPTASNFQERDRIETNAHVTHTVIDAGLRREQPSLPRSKCLACHEDKPGLLTTARCSHPERICSECLIQWLTAQLETNDPQHIRCPGPECTALLTYDEFLRAAPSLAGRHDHMLRNHALRDMSGFKWCLNPGCGGGQVIPEGESFMKCASCGHRQCVRHATIWHDDRTCAEYDVWLHNHAANSAELASQKWIASRTKSCPNRKCGWHIEKRDGCNVMTCRQCGQVFCWKCLKDFDQRGLAYAHTRSPHKSQ